MACGIYSSHAGSVGVSPYGTSYMQGSMPPSPYPCRSLPMSPTVGSENVSQLRRLFLALTSDENKMARGSELIQRFPEGEVSAAVSAVLDQMLTFPSSIALGAFLLG
eukprot:1407380-Amphidinium_carterae.1